MRFTVRPGTDPVARADGTLLKALGLPAGGVVSVGRTHVLALPGTPTDPTGIEMGPIARTNGGITTGTSVDVRRAVLPTARTVWIDAETLPMEGRALVRAMAGRPVSTGDRVDLGPTAGGDALEIRIDRVEPNPAGIVGSATRFVDRGAGSAPPPVSVDDPGRHDAPTTSQALLAGLDGELDLLTGWFTLLTAPDDLPSAWGLPRVAGVLLDGPPGCGASELVRAAAEAAGATVHEVDVDLVFKPERLLDLLSQALDRPAPLVVFVDRLEAVAGEEGLTPFRSQVGAILRWFLDSVAGRPGTACVLAVASRAHLDPAIARSPLLPRSMTVPPPDLTRRRLLFEAALARVPSSGIDHELLAARSAGFSGSDVVAAVMHASAMAARTGDGLTTSDLLAAIEATTPSLGTVPMGEMPSYGFDEVADLVEVKQRLTESVIWPVTDPARFRSMGIDPPRGILLFGPPGTGKTFVVRALAHEAGAAFFAVKGAELLDKYVGESERGVREVFARARAAEPSILFFDELDALAPVRGRSTTSVTDSVVAALLTEIDGVAARGSVAVIGATNRRDLIDPALLRAGRFEIQIELGLPGADARLALLRLSDVPFADDVDLERLADLTEGRSFADLAGLLREAALASLRADVGAREVHWEHVESALAARPG